MYLTFNEGKKGKLLARNTEMQYYRRAKICILDQFPLQRALLESRLLEAERTQHNFCLKRAGRDLVACTKLI